MLLTRRGMFAAVLSRQILSQTPSKTQESSASRTVGDHTTHTVAVGSTGHHFEPSEVKANVGDIVEYLFYPQNHSVARAAFEQPCIPYEYTAPSRVGFWSGFFPVQLVLSDPPRFQVRVNDSQPVFFYCSAPGACLDGMVGVINPTSTQTFDMQHQFTQNATQEFSPGEVYFEPEDGSNRNQTSSSSNSQVADHSHKLGGGAITGIVISAVFGVAFVAGLIYVYGRHAKVNENLQQQLAKARTSANLNKSQSLNIPTVPGTLDELDIASYENSHSPRRSGPPVTAPNCISPRSDTGHVSSSQYSQAMLLLSKPLTPLPNHQTQHPDSSGPHELPVALDKATSAYSPESFSFAGSETPYTGERL